MVAVHVDEQPEEMEVQSAAKKDERIMIMRIILNHYLFIFRGCCYTVPLDIYCSSWLHCSDAILDRMIVVSISIGSRELI
jgi:hypothetical protein